MKERKPNHICRNPNCNKGENGGKKRYYACDFCDRTHQWRAFACCPECYKEFIKANTVVEPKRIDKDIEEIMSKPIEEVKANTIEELSDMKEVVETKGITGAIEEINKAIDNKPKTKARKCDKS